LRFRHLRRLRKLDPDISFKKLAALAEGAAIASRRLWGRA
jgi:hypothetical protein